MRHKVVLCHLAKVKKREHIYEQLAFIHPAVHEGNWGNSQLFH